METVGNQAVIFQLKEQHMLELLQKLAMIQLAEMNGVEHGMDEDKLIKRIKKHHHKHPFAQLGLPKEEYANLQQVLKS